jgi:phosphoglycolate phosphatase
MKYRAVLFDLDGTLLDTLQDLADSMNRVLAADGYPVHERDRYRYFVGNGVRKLVERALPGSERAPELVDRAVAAMRKDYALHWADTTRPYPGVPEMLDALSERRLSLTILSNKPDDFTRLCVERLLPDWDFAVVAGARADVPIKPDPAGARRVAGMIGIAPADFLYLGDSSVDMDTAVAAGMFPVGALWGFRTREELEAHGARALSGHPRDVVALLS